MLAIRHDCGDFLLARTSLSYRNLYLATPWRQEFDSIGQRCHHSKPRMALGLLVSIDEQPVPIADYLALTTIYHTGSLLWSLAYAVFCYMSLSPRLSGTELRFRGIEQAKDLRYSADDRLGIRFSAYQHMITVPGHPPLLTTTRRRLLRSQSVGPSHRIHDRKPPNMWVLQRNSETINIITMKM